MDIKEETQKKIQELQTYEQNLQSLLLQRQAFQMELSETQNALSEISSSKEDVFKMIGNIMVKTNKEKIEKELKRKIELLSLRIKSIEKQESEISKKVENLRKEVLKELER